MNKYLVFIFAILFSPQLNAQSQGKPDARGFVVKVGDMSPDFTITYPDSTTKKLSDFRGQVIMLQFTASWCGVCRKEMPHIEKHIWQPNKEKGLVLLGIDRGESADKVEAFSKKMKITYPLALDLNDEIFTLYADKNAGVTRNVVIDKNGKIVFLTRLFNKKEFKEMKKTIAKLLDE